MKNFTQSAVLFSLLTITAFISMLTAQVTIGKDQAPIPGSVLDLSQVEAQNLGLLLPKVQLASLTAWAPVDGSAVDGMFIYNTAVSPVPGIYYWKDSKWNLLSSNFWSLTGNAGTTAGTNFVGTTDATDLLLGANNRKSMLVSSNSGTLGFVGINRVTYPNATYNPGSLLHVFGTFAGNYEARDYPASGGSSQVVLNASSSYYLSSKGTAAYDPDTEPRPRLWYILPQYNAAINTSGRHYYFRNSSLGVISVYPYGSNYTTVGNEQIDDGSTGVSRIDVMPGETIFLMGTGNNPATNRVTWDLVGRMSRNSGIKVWSMGGNKLAGLPTSSNPRFFGTQDGYDLLIGTNNVERMRILSTGNIGIGTTAPAYKLDVAGDINASGSVYANGVALTSDIRYKTNIATIQEPLSIITRLRGTTYDFNKPAFPEKNFPDGKQYGVIAQEAEKVMPEIVSADADGYKSVNYTEIIPVLVEAMKEQQKTIQQLEARVKELESKK